MYDLLIHRMFTVWLRHLHDVERSGFPAAYSIYSVTRNQRTTYFAANKQFGFEIEWWHLASLESPNKLSIRLIRVAEGLTYLHKVTSMEAFWDLFKDHLEAYVCVKISPQFKIEGFTIPPIPNYLGSENHRPPTETPEERVSKLAQALHEVFVRDFQFPPLDLSQLEHYARLEPATSPSAEQILTKHKRNKTKKKPK